MNMGLGLTSTIVGPLYAFRNVIINHADAAIKLGSNSFGNIYLYQNTIYSTGSGAGPSFFGNNAIADNITSRNNIIWLEHGRLCENWDSSGDRGLNSFDYDALWTNREASGFSWSWYSERYGDLAYFQTTTGQELHAVLVPDPMFVEPGADDFTLQSTSPCIDKGVVLPGFNDADSPWPYQGAAPDIGAYEFGSGTPSSPLLQLSGLSISPSTVEVEENVTISIEARNISEFEGDYTVRLMIDGSEEAIQEFTLAPAAIDVITFTTARDTEGSYSVEIDGLRGEFTVIAPSPFPWALLGGILGGVLAALAVTISLYLVLHRRRTGLTDRAGEVKR